MKEIYIGDKRPKIEQTFYNFLHNIKDRRGFFQSFNMGLLDVKGFYWGNVQTYNCANIFLPF